jgi:hypothetical protein
MPYWYIYCAIYKIKTNKIMEDNKVKSSIIIGLAVIITAFILGMALKTEMRI